MRARIGDVIDETPASRTFVVDTIAPTVLTITSGPSGRDPRDQRGVPVHVVGSAAARFECTHVFPDGARSTIDCESGWNPYDFEDGVHGFEIAAIDRGGQRRHATRAP